MEPEAEPERSYPRDLLANCFFNTHAGLKHSSPSRSKLKNIVCGDGGSQSNQIQVKQHDQISEADLEEVAVPWLKTKICQNYSELMSRKLLISIVLTGFPSTN